MPLVSVSKRCHPRASLVAALLWIAEIVSHVVHEYHLLGPRRRDLVRGLIVHGRYRRGLLRRLPTRGCGVGLLALPVVLSLCVVVGVGLLIKLMLLLLMLLLLLLLMLLQLSHRWRLSVVTERCEARATGRVRG